MSSTNDMDACCCVFFAGEFYWMESVQTYNEGGWDYTTELRKFVEGGMIGTSFIDSVSGIVNRGCHNPVSWETTFTRKMSSYAGQTFILTLF